MDFVALISGGKDSLFSIMEAVVHGYHLRALVHLAPKMTEYGAEEQDSYMYQSVASEGVKYIAKALNVPLICLPIVGQSTFTERNYIVHQSDEVEDLYRALSHAIVLVPSLKFVSSGAILSDYQRIRVEHVASRLGLGSLAFLWRRSQDALLQDMINADLDAIIVKVASFGLQAEQHLGQHLCDLQPRLLELAKSCQLNVCGEGGEYETFTLDCPLFEQRICLRSTPRLVIHSKDDCYPVAYLRLTDLCLQPKLTNQICRTRVDLLSMKWRSGCGLVKEIDRRPFLDPNERLLDLDSLVCDEISRDRVIDPDSARQCDSESSHTIVSNGTIESPLLPERLGSMVQGRLLITSTCIGTCAIQNELNLTVSKATSQAIAKLKSVLASLDCSTDQLVHCWAVLNQPLTPTTFDAFNQVYVAEFGLPWELKSAIAVAHTNRVFPPTRACFVVDPILAKDGTLYQSEHMTAVGLIGVLCPLSESGDRPVLTGGHQVQGMHVRSLSHWAPANIGPYSQALSVRLRNISPHTIGGDGAGDDEKNQSTVVTFYSGQIGLVPETLTLINRTPCLDSTKPRSDTKPDIHGECLITLRHCHRLMKAQSNRLWSELSVAICFGTTHAALVQARQTFHQTVCSSWFLSDTSHASIESEDSCACERRVIFVHVTDLPKHACVEWQLITASNPGCPESIVYYSDLYPFCSTEKLRSASILFACHEASLSEIYLKCPIVPCCGFLNRTEPFAALYL